MVATDETLRSLANDSLTRCGAEPLSFEGVVEARSPITGHAIGSVAASGDVDAAVDRATDAFATWRTTPAPRRAEVIRALAALLRAHKADLARLVQVEVGKIESEALGEVQEMIDICDFAVGLGRQLHGLTIASERPGHRLMEQWHPLGPCGVITAFNFPVAVWSWNAALAIVCGDPVVWKPSELTPLTAIAVTRIAEKVCRATGVDGAVFALLIGDTKTVGQPLAADRRLPLISATGSCAMGVEVGQAVQRRMGR